jgi:hypothetical protein
LSIQLPDKNCAFIYDGVVQATGQFVEIKGALTVDKLIQPSAGQIPSQLPFDASQAAKPLWIFVNGQPSHKLIALLRDAGIPWARLVDP